MSKEINIVQVQTALLMPVTAQFIVDKLGVKPVRTDKRAMFWSRDDFTHICQGIIQHVTSVRNADFDSISAQRPKKDDAAAPAPAPAAAASDEGFDFGDADEGFDFGGETAAEPEGFF